MNKDHPTIRFRLVHKLIASYTAMTLFTLAAIVFSLTGLYSLHRIARDIARNDLVIISSIQQLSGSMQAQERNAGKYAILKRTEFQELFRRRESEFMENLRELERSGRNLDLSPLQSNYQTYRTAVDRMFQGKEEDTQFLKDAADKVTADINTLYNEQRRLLNAKLEAADRKQNSTVRWTFILSFTGFLLAICVAVIFTYNISSAIRKLKRATLRIAEGDFDYDPQISMGDEIGELARDFTRMAAKLKILEQVSLDASPLTRLPGNTAIERALNSRLSTGAPFAVCYADLDNFKAYNDRYGYIKASEVIKMTGEIIDNAVKKNAGNDAFIGHVGGDDFVMVVSSDEAPAVCEAVIQGFSDKIGVHYTPEDISRGGIEGVDRYGVPRLFPIMTISIAVIICQKGEYDSAVDIAKAAADIKEYVKGVAGSNYFINRRKNKR